MIYTLVQIKEKLDSYGRKISILFSKVKTIEEDGVLPDQTNNAGKILVSDGTNAVWGTPTPSGGVRDPVPTDGSTNSVESNGIFDALALKANISQIPTSLNNLANGTTLIALSPTEYSNFKAIEATFFTP